MYGYVYVYVKVRMGVGMYVCLGIFTYMCMSVCMIECTQYAIHYILSAICVYAHAILASMIYTIYICYILRPIHMSLIQSIAPSLSLRQSMFLTRTLVLILNKIQIQTARIYILQTTSVLAP